MDLDEVAHDEPPHQDLRLAKLAILSLVVKELTAVYFELCSISENRTKYSRTSMARTLMARLPRLFRTRS